MNILVDVCFPPCDNFYLCTTFFWSPCIQIVFSILSLFYKLLICLIILLILVLCILSTFWFFFYQKEKTYLIGNVNIVSYNVNDVVVVVVMLWYHSSVMICLCNVTGELAALSNTIFISPCKLFTRHILSYIWQIFHLNFWEKIVVMDVIKDFGC